MAKQAATKQPDPWVENQRKAIDLFREGKPGEALAMLGEIERNYSKDPRALLQVANTYYNMGNMLLYEDALRRLVNIEGVKVDTIYILADAYRANGRQALALSTYQEALKRWPADDRAREAKRYTPDLEKAMFKEALNNGVSIDLALDLFVMNDEVRYALDHGDLIQARQLVKKLLRRKRDFVPALNNLVQIDSMEGNYEQAIRDANEILAIDANNVSAISLLVRLNFLGGRPETARQLTERLKQTYLQKEGQDGQRSLARQTGQLMRIAEALTFVEDDQAMLDLYERVQAEKVESPNTIDAGFFHLAAVAAWRLGKEDLARELWMEALKQAPYFAWAKENLENAQKPAAERDGIWAFPFEYWNLSPVSNEITAILERSPNRMAAQITLNRFLIARHPEVIFLAPHLLARGDARSREFAARIATSSGHGPLVEAVRSFALGQSGSFDERMKLAGILVEGGQIQPGLVKLWKVDRWQETLLLDVQVDAQAIQTHYEPPVAELALKANQALMTQDGAGAQAALEQALVLLPDEPLLLSNLGLAYELQGEYQRANDLLRSVHARHPDEFFPTIGAVRLALDEGALEQARALADGLMARKKMHVTEFTALCMVQIELARAEGNRSASQAWLDLWERKDPTNPSLADYRKLIKKRK